MNGGSHHSMLPIQSSLEFEINGCSQEGCHRTLHRHRLFTVRSHVRLSKTHANRVAHVHRGYLHGVPTCVLGTAEIRNLLRRVRPSPSRTCLGVPKGANRHIVDRINATPVPHRIDPARDRRGIAGPHRQLFEPYETLSDTSG